MFLYQLAARSASQPVDEVPKSSSRTSILDFFFDTTPKSLEHFSLEDLPCAD